MTFVEYNFIILLAFGGKKIVIGPVGGSGDHEDLAKIWLQLKFWNRVIFWQYEKNKKPMV